MRGESHTHTASRDLHCDPDYWHSLDWDTTESEVSRLIGGLVTGLQPDIAVELGCHRGQTSVVIGLHLENNGHGKLYALDKQADYCQRTRERCAKLPVEVVLVDANRWTPPGSVDFAFVDHGEVDRRLEGFHNLLPHLSPRAVVVFHDAGTHWTLRRQLIAAFRHPEWDIVFLPTPRGLAICKRRDLS